MSEIFKHLKPIQNMMALALLMLLFILAFQTSAIAQSLCDGQVPTIVGTAGHDFVEGTAGSDVIHGLGGHDVIEGKGGDDIICGGDGHDVISGGDGDDTLIGGEGADHLVGGAGNDYLSGGKGHDELFGCTGDDELWGNWGNDTLIGGDGDDVLWGGTGPGSGTINNNDTCYDTLSSFIRGCEVFYGENTLRLAPVPKTGQTKSYAAGDDGDLQKGVQWPDPRFTDNGDGTVTDNLTGLIWLKKADCFVTDEWNIALDVSNNLADAQCGLSDGSVAGDWHLPNLFELRSLIDYGNFDPAIPKGHPFSGVTNSIYWTSTTSQISSIHSVFVYMLNGNVYQENKAPCCIRYVWPVRGGND